MAGSWRYSRWDGRQAAVPVGAEEVLAEIGDDLLYHGDVHAALRRLLQNGLEREGVHLPGVRELLERLRERRRRILSSARLDGVYDDVRRRLDAVEQLEREEVARRLAAGAAGGEATGLHERELELDMLADDLPGRLRGLDRLELLSEQARARLEELKTTLRRDLAERSFRQLAGALAHPDPESLARTREMLDRLNRLIEQRRRGEPLDPSFEEFLDRFGDLLPGSPETLEQLLAALAAEMAATQAMFESLDEGQRAELEALAEGLLADVDLRWQVERLADNLRQAVPGAGWDRRYRFSGATPLDLGGAAEAFAELGELDALENLLRAAGSPGALAEVDFARASELLGPDAGPALAQLSELAATLEDAGYVRRREGYYDLTPRAIRRLGDQALRQLFRRLEPGLLGRHDTYREGAGDDPAGTSRPYRFGDRVQLDIPRTIRNALVRRGGGVPVRVEPDDFEVEERELLTRGATVLALDLSLSMPMRDNFLAAKKVAIALHSLIASRFPRDYLGVVGFSEVARELTTRELPEVSWDFVYGTNLQHALALARRMLGHQRGSRQILLITDGEPTAHVQADGEVFFSYPPTPETLQATMAEVVRATRDGITINTFMLEASAYLRRFVERMTEVNRGRAFFTTPENLGTYVLVDFLEHRRSGMIRPAG